MIFLGCLFDRRKEKIYLKKSKTGLSNAANTFQWNLIDGFKANKQNVKILNVLPIGTFPRAYKDLFLKKAKWEYEGDENLEIGCLNLPFIKQYQRYMAIKKQLKKSSDREIVIYSAYEPFLHAIYKLDKSYKVTVIITDVPEYYDLGKTSALKAFLRRINNKRIYKYMKRVDNFVFLTEQMNTLINTENKPYVIVEGICNGEIISNVQQSKEKAILYTGTLHKQFGILNLLEAFSLIEDKNLKLWICGGGDSKAEVEQAAANDSRITYFGYVTKEEILKLQQKATVLINPRNNDGEYTKYSFPSKTMEYMLSGKPVIMYKLDGVPNEYDSYLYYINGNTAEDMKNTILEVLNKNEEELETFGQKASEFVNENKNSVVQAKRILSLLK